MQGSVHTARMFGEFSGTSWGVVADVEAISLSRNRGSLLRCSAFSERAIALHVRTCTVARLWYVYTVHLESYHAVNYMYM